MRLLFVKFIFVLKNKIMIKSRLWLSFLGKSYVNEAMQTHPQSFCGSKTLN